MQSAIHSSLQQHHNPFTQSLHSSSWFSYLVLKRPVPYFDLCENTNNDEINHILRVKANGAISILARGGSADKNLRQAMTPA